MTGSAGGRGIHLSGRMEGFAMSEIEMVGVALTVGLLVLWAWRYYATR
jgi:hypothetical protein